MPELCRDEGKEPGRRCVVMEGWKHGKRSGKSSSADQGRKGVVSSGLAAVACWILWDRVAPH